MKINIYIPVKDAIKGKLNHNNYSTTDPDNSDWVQVSISPDEFTKMLDSEETSKVISEFWEDDTQEKKDKSWNIKQYNRNREPKDWIDDMNDAPFGD